MNENYLSNQSWSKLFVIFRQFGYEFKNYKENKENLDKLWLELLKIQKEWLTEIEKVIRLNTNLCFKLDRESEIKNVNAPLYRMHNFLDKNYFKPDKDARIGLKKFLKSINEIFDNLKNLKKDIKVIKKILEFYKNRDDKLLIEYYEYLNRIVLPVNGYENLRIALFSVLKKFEHLKILVSVPSAFDNLIKELEKFKKLYISRYVKEHNKFQKQINSFYLKLYKLKQYRILKLLSKINIIKTNYSYKHINKYIKNFFPKTCCESNIYNILQVKPTCNCGFVLNENTVIPTIKKITPLLEKGIYDYLFQLKNKTYFREKLELYYKENNDSQVEKLLYEKNDIIELCKIIDSKLIDKINLALNDTYFIDISSDEFINKIIGSYCTENINDFSQVLQKKILTLLEKKYDKSSTKNNEKIIINIVKK